MKQGESMDDRVTIRLEELRGERDKGRRALAEAQADMAALEAEQQRLKEQLLRIDGAIRVLEELSHDGEDHG